MQTTSQFCATTGTYVWELFVEQSGIGGDKRCDEWKDGLPPTRCETEMRNKGKKFTPQVGKNELHLQKISNLPVKLSYFNCDTSQSRLPDKRLGDRCTKLHSFGSQRVSSWVPLCFLFRHAVRLSGWRDAPPSQFDNILKAVKQMPAKHETEMNLNPQRDLPSVGSHGSLRQRLGLRSAFLPALL
ncbi:hypothetical protein KIN20_004664 [Parelaphostrongylus tenuis]|uniref:Uncharacterized protein n=1 Tax=Parelaphostrongylus tenuis TaxID=148309 RepID=A0AAD5QI53_PARTN|nr:hypothetical protein KIN20_004664 [Parelaphostrongylus tenuis]